MKPSNNKNTAQNRRKPANKKAGLSTQEKKRRASKKSALETVYKEEVIEMFLKWFKQQKAETGHIMSKTDILKNIIKNIDAKQDGVLEQAMKELSDKGLLETQEDGFSLMLTAKGAKSL